MNKLWAVIRREFLTKVQTKAFVIGTVLGPVLMAGLFVLPILLSTRTTSTRRIVVLDAASGQLGERIYTELAFAQIGRDSAARSRYQVARVRVEGPLDQARDSLVALTGFGDVPGSLDGIVVLTDSALTVGRVGYLGANAGSPADMSALESLIEPVLLAVRLEARGVDPAVVREADLRLRLDQAKVAEGKLTGASGEASFVLSYAMAFILYIALLMYGIQVLTSVLEEKSSRVMEVLVSSVTPFQLLLGKVIGVGSVGLFQLSIWIGTALLVSSNLASIAGLFGVPPEAVSGANLPSLSFDLMVVFLAFFLVGFFLYAAAYAAVGSMTNSLQEAQQSATVVNLCIVVGFIAVFSLLNDPNNSLGRIMSLIPLFAPMVMPVRYSVTPVPWPEVGLSLGITILGMLLVVWLASRIYRIGILMYGKKPSLKELLHWVRA